MQETHQLQQIDRGLTSSKATAFLEHQRKEQELLTKGVVTNTDSELDQLTAAPAQYKETKADGYPEVVNLGPEPLPVRSNASDQAAIIIQDQKESVELSFQAESGTFTVGLTAKSVEISEDGISILIDNKVIIKPPSLVPLKIRINNTPYTVVYAGGTHAFGPLRNISFVRTTNNG